MGPTKECPGMPGNARECPGTFVECPGVGKECPEEITLIITLVTNKKHLFYERLNYSCNIWHCKYCSGNAGCHKRMPGSRKRMPGVKLRTANVRTAKYTQNISVKYIFGNKDVFGSKTYYR